VASRLALDAGDGVKSMSNTAWIIIIAWCWLWWRLDRLGKQLEAVSFVRQIEMADVVGNEERVKELLEERTQDQAEKKRAIRQFLITWGVIGAAALAWWWFSQH
jgi:hypothetical protein